MMRAVTTTPVIIATARHEEAEIIRLLNAGADDYLVKPFSCEHLAARISAQLRRAGPGARPRSSASAAQDRPGQAGGRARRNAGECRAASSTCWPTSPPGRVVVSRRELLTEVWHQAYGDDQTIDVHVSWCGASSARRPPGRDTCARCAASA